MGGHQRDYELVQALELAVQEPGAPPQLAQRDAGGVAGDIAGAGPQRRQPGYQSRRRVPGEPGPQVIGAGQDQGPGVAGRRGGELPDAEQPADGIERGGDMRAGVGVHAASDRACFFYDGQGHPFLRLRDGTHPLAVGPVNPGL